MSLGITCGIWSGIPLHSRGLFLIRRQRHRDKIRLQPGRASAPTSRTVGNWCRRLRAQCPWAQCPMTLASPPSTWACGGTLRLTTRCGARRLWFTALERSRTKPGFLFRTHIHSRLSGTRGGTLRLTTRCGARRLCFTALGGFRDRARFPLESLVRQCPLSHRLPQPVPQCGG